jgi:isocitrate/isopropylmalate dehydrogenase
MLLRHSLKAEGAAKAIESAVGAALKAGARTRDIAGSGAKSWLTTKTFTDVVLEHLPR